VEHPGRRQPPEWPGARLSAQKAAAKADSSGAFIETVGGETTRELPPPITYDVDGDGVLNADELGTAVEERYPKIIWPEAYAVPLEDLLAAIDASDQASWPINSEFRVLEIPAVCAWFHAYLDAHERGNTLQQPAALDQAMYVLGGVRSLTAEESLGAVDAIRYATLGNAGLIEAYVEEGPCQNQSWFDDHPDATPVASPVSRVRGEMR
jgi:hypothetical protein